MKSEPAKGGYCEAGENGGGGNSRGKCFPKFVFGEKMAIFFLFCLFFLVTYIAKLNSRNVANDETISAHTQTHTHTNRETKTKETEEDLDQLPD